MGGNRRRGSRRRERQRAADRSTAGAPPAPRTRRRPAWRRTIDSWGGFSLVGSVLVAIVIVGGLVLLNRPGTSVNDEPYVPLERTGATERSWGKPNAPVKIIEFADFQCPFCARFALETEPLLAAEFIDTGIVQLTFHHFAFLGPESGRSAEAAECAGDQGRFWDYHDLLFLRQGRENSGVFSSDHLKQFAAELRDAYPDFDEEAFGSCLDSGRKRTVVEETTRQAADAGIQQTPSFLINGKLLTGAQGIDVFRQAIEQAVDAAASR